MATNRDLAGPILLALGLIGPGCDQGASPKQGAAHAASARVEVPRREAGDWSGPEAQTNDVEALRSLGYVEVGEPLAPDEKVGVRIFDRARAQPGINLMTDAHICQTHLIDMEGRILHSWSHSSPCLKWGNAALLPNGDLLVAGRVPHEETYEAELKARYLLRLGWDGTLLWKRELPAHHDVESTPDGHVLTMTYEHRIVPAIHPSIPVRDHSLVLFSSEGELVEKVSMLELLAGARDLYQVTAVAPRTRNGETEIDLIHSNSVEWMRHKELFGTHPIYGEDHVLFCMRHQDAIAIVDWSKKRLVWAWGHGQISGPHDATLLPSGNILVFDNGLGRNWSRVVEVDPRRKEIVWTYQAPDRPSFFSGTRGGNQRLANGNTLITESDRGRVFEVTEQGEIVWEYQNPSLTEEREPGVIVRARRIEGIDFEELRRRAMQGVIAPVD